MLGSLGHRVRSAALDFARWAPSAGVLLLIATVAAILLTNSALGPRFTAFWQTPLGLSFNDAHFRLTLLEWVNDGLLTVFFLVVGLEIKREFTVGHLSTRRSAALPVAAALGGMTAPALLYHFLAPAAWARGWGIPIGTDTAFAIALIVMMGRRVPVELRIFLTASAIVDDLGAIIVVALFYSSHLHFGYLAAAAAVVAALAIMNRVNIYRPAPYVWLGLLLWFLIHAGGLHATLAGVLLALFIPTREPPNFAALMSQADAILVAEARHSGEALRHGPSTAVMAALDAIHDRLESPADRMLRVVSLRSNYIVLPVFALANAGVAMSMHVLDGHERLMAAIVVGLVVGKPLGIISASWLAARTGLAEKPEAYSWAQLIGAGALSGIGFTMSLFIAGRAFPGAADFAAAKIAVFTASLIAAAIGSTVLLVVGRRADA
jgi:NhaA family Na+:H+ antiporter